MSGKLISAAVIHEIVAVGGDESQSGVFEGSVGSFVGAISESDDSGDRQRFEEMIDDRHEGLGDDPPTPILRIEAETDLGRGFFGFHPHGNVANEVVIRVGRVGYGELGPGAEKKWILGRHCFGKVSGVVKRVWGCPPLVLGDVGFVAIPV